MFKKVLYVFAAMLVVILSACGNSDDRCNQTHWSQNQRPYDPEYEQWRQQRANSEFGQQQAQQHQYPQQAPVVQQDSGIGTMVGAALVGAAAGAIGHKLLTDKQKTNAGQHVGTFDNTPSISQPAPADLKKPDLNKPLIAKSQTQQNQQSIPTITPAPKPATPTVQAPAPKSYSFNMKDAPTYKTAPAAQRYVPVKQTPKISYTGSAFKSGSRKK